MYRLNNADISNIKAFLAFDNTELTPKTIYKLALGNILIPFLCILGVVSSPLTWTVAIVESIFFIVFMLYFKGKVKQTQKQINLYYAIDWMFMSVNLCYFSCMVFSLTIINIFIPMLAYFAIVSLCSYLTVRIVHKKICEGKHNGKKFATAIISSVATFGAGLGLAWSRFSENLILNEKIYIGIISEILAIIFSLVTTCVFIKWYCYSILERKEKPQ